MRQLLTGAHTEVRAAAEVGPRDSFYSQALQRLAKDLLGERGREGGLWGGAVEGRGREAKGKEIGAGVCGAIPEHTHTHTHTHTHIDTLLDTLPHHGSPP